MPMIPWEFMNDAEFHAMSDPIDDALAMVARMRDAVARAQPGRMDLHADIAGLFDTLPTVPRDVADWGMEVKSECIRLQYAGCDVMGDEARAHQAQALAAIDELADLIGAMDRPI